MHSVILEAILHACAYASSQLHPFDFLIAHVSFRLCSSPTFSAGSDRCVSARARPLSLPRSLLFYQDLVEFPSGMAHALRDPQADILGSSLGFCRIVVTHRIIPRVAPGMLCDTICAVPVTAGVTLPFRVSPGATMRSSRVQSWR